MQYDIPRKSSSANIADLLVGLEQLDATNLLELVPDLDRIFRNKGVRVEYRKSGKTVRLGSVPLGATFVYPTDEMFGVACGNSRNSPFEGMLLKVVNFRPRYVNQVVVEDPSGCQSLLPLWQVERALKYQTG
jgi:hypothetical protein